MSSFRVGLIWAAGCVVGFEKVTERILFICSHIELQARHCVVGALLGFQMALGWN